MHACTLKLQVAVSLVFSSLSSQLAHRYAATARDPRYATWDQSHVWVRTFVLWLGKHSGIRENRPFRHLHYSIVGSVSCDTPLVR